MSDDYILTEEAYAMIQHVGTPNSLNRLKHPIAAAPENAYAELWAKANKRQPHLNSGCATLELLLHDWLKRPWPYPNSVDSISQRDAEVAATVIQWLGTSCGQAFIHAAEEKIEKNRKATP